MSYISELRKYLQEHRDILVPILRFYLENGENRNLFLRSDIWEKFEYYCRKTGNEQLLDSLIADLFSLTQEAAIRSPWFYIALRPRIANWNYLRINLEIGEVEEIKVNDFLKFKEFLVDDSASEKILEIDLTPFERDFPKMHQTRSIGRGVEYLNRRLSSRLSQNFSQGDRPIFPFLQMHSYKGTPFMLGSSMTSVQQLQRALNNGLEYLGSQPAEAQWEEISTELRKLGFEPGWGRTVGHIRENFSLLADILEAPDYGNLEKFLSRIPMIFNIVILSPHGYFGQENVLGLPDTGGQIVYILDQVRALEKEMRQRIYDQGLDIEPQILIISRLIPEAEDTTCNQPVEEVSGTRNVKIMRVPFRNKEGKVVNHWISRFRIWPYLEDFALEVEDLILEELEGRPDLIIGNYSDGNLAASILSERLGVTQCNIAHALEKTKYLFSALYWRDLDPDYHFSCQFTADLIAMNTADFIITSTYQEIAGSKQEIGQYESYASFTMPRLYRVIKGVDVFDPKFNIVSPGADDETYFSHKDENKRRTDLHGEIERLVFGDPKPGASRGRLKDQEKPLIFSLARLDRIKNLTGLVNWFADCPELREEANLLIIGGVVAQEDSRDQEEQEQVLLMHKLLDEYGLDSQVRWLGMRLDKNLSGELYRWIADRRGAFVQPAFFEAFGLTVIEAMASGLPTFATCYGGPLEIIEDGISGFHIDPNHGDIAAQKVAAFFRRCREDASYWDFFSNSALQRIRERYTWQLYAERLMSLSCIYGFWKYTTNLERQETRRYLEMFRALQFRPLAEGMRED
ncbi:MAG: sucrose synthase [Desulfurivibrionaceae bacterium]